MQEVNYAFDIIVIIFYYTVGIVSILASLFLIAAFAFFKENRTRSFELVVYLSICLMLSNISYIMHYTKIVDPVPSRWNSICLAQASLMTIGEIGQTLFTTFIAYSIYSNIVYFNQVKAEDRLSDEDREYTSRLAYILIGFGIPVLVGFGFIPLGVYGKSNHWCWLATPYFYDSPVDDQNKPFNLELVPIIGVVYYCFIWTLQITNYYFFFSTISVLRSNIEDEGYVNNYIVKLVQFPLIQLFIVFPQTLTKLLLTQNLKDLSLPAISVSLITVQGLLYTLSYGYNDSIRGKLKLILRIIFCCDCKKTHELSDELTERNTLFEKNKLQKIGSQETQRKSTGSHKSNYSGYSDDNILGDDEKKLDSPEEFEDKKLNEQIVQMQVKN